jgi:hypothetical protein
MSHNLLFAGFTSAIMPDWQEFVVQPTAPSNYKDPVKIANAVNEKMMKQEQAATRTPVLSFLTNAVIADEGGHVLFSESSNEIGKVSVLLATFLKEYFPVGIRSESNYGVGNPLVGFDVKTMLSIMGIEVLHYNAKYPGQRIVLPVKLWCDPSVVDPYTKMLDGATRELVDMDALCARVGISCPDGLESSPTTQVDVARALATVGFFNPTAEMLGIPEHATA